MLVCHRQNGRKKEEIKYPANSLLTYIQTEAEIYDFLFLLLRPEHGSRSAKLAWLWSMTKLMLWSFRACLEKFHLYTLRERLNTVLQRQETFLLSSIHANIKVSIWHSRVHICNIHITFELCQIKISPENTIFFSTVLTLMTLNQVTNNWYANV